jgi:hypothetical protein
MKRNYLFLLMILFLCTACPYESVQPIGEPTVPISKALIGVWKDAVGEPDNYDIRKFDDFTYLITENTYRKEDKALEQKRFKAHLSLLDGNTYLNIKMIKDSVNVTISDNFFLYKITIQDKKMTLHPLSQYIKEQFDTPADLQGFIRKYQDLSFFYATESEYVKVND